MTDEQFEAHIKSTAWYGVLSQAAKDDDDGASVFRMARMAAREAWYASNDLIEQQAARIAELEAEASQWKELAKANARVLGDSIKQEGEPLAAAPAVDAMTLTDAEFCAISNALQGTAFHGLADNLRAHCATPQSEGWRKDAERYRWLRQQHWNEADVFVIAGSKSQVRLGTDCPRLDRLDAAIDAALSQKESGASC